MTKKVYTVNSKQGRTTLQNKTLKFVTHIIQNEKWLNDKIGELQEIAEQARQSGDIIKMTKANEQVADFITQHRLFISDVLPYCLPKLSATMNSGDDAAGLLIKELMGLEKKPTDSATNTDKIEDTKE